MWFKRVKYNFEDSKSFSLGTLEENVLITVRITKEKEKK